ncbi:hypothetical protein [Parasphingorhabdus sp.]|uniref:hypothetical protein n=1 Tax=Parasphingorhabdus sp. TaxID=2709688 RepID=UPI00300105C1
MTVINAFKQGKVGYMFTDTAHVDTNTGQVLAFGSKAFLAANFPAIVGATLIGGHLPFLINDFVADPPKNVRALQRKLPTACKHFIEKAKLHGSDDPFVRLIAMAWCSRTKSIRIFYCSNTADEGFADAFEVVELDFFFGTGVNTPEVQAAMDKLNRREPVGGDDEMIKLMDAQRRAPFAAMDPALDGVNGIGGSIEKLEVTKRQVTADVDIHKWPDAVGLPIAPMEAPESLSQRVDGVLAA